MALRPDYFGALKVNSGVEGWFIDTVCGYGDPAQAKVANPGVELIGNMDSKPVGNLITLCGICGVVDARARALRLRSGPVRATFT